MKFHGFASVSAWLEEFKRLKDYPWDVTVQTFHRVRSSDWSYREHITMHTLPYGDEISNIAEDDPALVKVVTVSGRTPTACVSQHLFSEDLSHYYALALAESMEKALEAWGFESFGSVVCIC